MNVPKIKGTHNAMKSGIMAADSSLEALRDGSKPGRVDNECCHDTGICVCVCPSVSLSAYLSVRLLPSLLSRLETGDTYLLFPSCRTTTVNLLCIMNAMKTIC